MATWRSSAAELLEALNYEIRGVPISTLADVDVSEWPARCKCGVPRPAVPDSPYSYWRHCCSPAHLGVPLEDWRWLLYQGAKLDDFRLALYAAILAGGGTLEQFRLTNHESSSPPTRHTRNGGSR